MDKQFLPSDYKIPSTSGYVKLKDGENTFRILSSAITGFEYWSQDNKPIRSKIYPTSTPDIRLDDMGNPTKVKHFWAFVVWNYETTLVQILEITQATIQRAIKALVDNKRWGDPKNYDITITKSGEGFDTAYVVQGNPPISDTPSDIIEKYNAKKISLGALFTGDNPFEAIDVLPPLQNEGVKDLDEQTEKEIAEEQQERQDFEESLNQPED